MDLKSLSDRNLLGELKRLVRTERELLATILHHLREVERRRLFDGQSSLFAYAKVVLGYPPDQASRRIAAMRLMNELPVIEPKIQTGELNLTHLGLAQSFFSNERKSGKPVELARKVTVLEAIIGQSTREAEKTLRQFATAAPRVKDIVKPLGDGRNQVITELSDETLAKLEQLKGRWAHSAPGATFAELIDRLCDLGLEQTDPAKAPTRKVKSDTRAAVRRFVWRRDGRACVKCKSTYALQEDHVTPKAMGGAYTRENMRLLCRSCNQRAAIEKLGLRKMEPFLSTSGAAGGVGRRTNASRDE